MLSKFCRSARRLAIGLVSVLAIPGAALAEPALWAIKDADSTIYLFGTIHVLKPEVQWRSARIDKALKDSAELVVETTDADDPAVMGPLIQQYGVDLKQPLSAKIGPDAFQRVRALAGGAAPVEALETLRPWFVAINLTMASVIKAGYDPKSGVDQVLMRDARAVGKPVNGFETTEQQIRFFADLPAKTETELLIATLEDADEGVAKFDAMVAAWNAGDVKGLEDEFIIELKTEHPALYDTIFVKRNQDWARQLKTKLAGKGVSFVAVGSGHLVGPESVQAELAKLGIKAERVE